MKKMFLLVFVFLIVSIAKAEEIKFPESVAQYAKERTAILYFMESSRIPAFQKEAVGCGALLENNVVVTNWHVIYPYYQVNFYDTRYTALKVEVNGQYYDLSILGLDVLYDLAFLKINTDEHLPHFSFAKRYALNEAVLSVGMPYEKIRHAAYGQINQINIDSSFYSNNPYNFFIHDAPSTYGSSGGPLVNRDKELMGLNTAMRKIWMRGKWSYGNQAISFHKIREILFASLMHQRDYNPSPLLQGVYNSFGVRIIKSEIPDIQENDVVLEINGRPLNDLKSIWKNMNIFDEIMQFTKGGGDWDFVIYRDLYTEGPLKIIRITVQI